LPALRLLCSAVIPTAQQARLEREGSKFAMHEELIVCKLWAEQLAERERAGKLPAKSAMQVQGQSYGDSGGALVGE
jgi:hypothetical protein